MKSKIEITKIDNKDKFKLPSSILDKNKYLYYLIVKNEIRLYNESEIENIIIAIYNYTKEKEGFKKAIHLKRILCAKLILEEKINKDNKIKLPITIRELFSDSLGIVKENNHLLLLNDKQIREYN